MGITISSKTSTQGSRLRIFVIMKDRHGKSEDTQPSNDGFRSLVDSWCTVTISSLPAMCPVLVLIRAKSWVRVTRSPSVRSCACIHMYVSIRTWFVHWRGLGRLFIRGSCLHRWRLPPWDVCPLAARWAAVSRMVRSFRKSLRPRTSDSPLPLRSTWPADTGSKNLGSFFNEEVANSRGDYGIL